MEALLNNLSKCFPTPLFNADGDFFVPVVRIDLLEKEGLPLPHTWDDLVELARYFNGTDLNDDGEADDDWGFCIYPRTGSGFNDAWIPELMYGTWATTDQVCVYRFESRLCLWSNYLLSCGLTSAHFHLILFYLQDSWNSRGVSV